MKLVKEMMLLFENCEASDWLSVGDMHEDDVNELHLEEISRSIHTMAVNAVAEFLKINNVKIVLNPKANRDCEMFGVSTGCLFNRVLECPDITQIILKWDDDTEDHFTVVWFDDEFENQYQKVILRDDGCLCITIKKAI